MKTKKQPDSVQKANTKEITTKNEATQESSTKQIKKPSVTHTTRLGKITKITTINRFKEAPANNNLPVNGENNLASTQASQQVAIATPNPTMSVEFYPNKRNSIGRILGLYAAAIVPVIGVAAVASAYLTTKQNNIQSASPTYFKMQDVLHSLNGEVDSKLAVNFNEITDKDIKLVGDATSGFKYYFVIYNKNYQKRTIQATLYLNSNDEEDLTLEKPIEIGGFPENIISQASLDIESAIQSIKGQVKALEPTSLAQRLLTKNNTDKTAHNFRYKDIYELDIDTGLTLSEIKKQGVDIKIVPNKQIPVFNPSTKKNDSLEIELSVEKDGIIKNTKVTVAGFISLEEYDGKRLDEALVGLHGVRFQTLKYKDKSNKHTIRKKYKEITDVFNDINYNIVDLYNNYPDLKFDSLKLDAVGENVVTVEATARLNETSKLVQFSISGYTPLTDFLADYLYDEINSMIHASGSLFTTTFNTKKLPSEAIKSYVNMDDFLTDVNLLSLKTRCAEEEITLKLADGSRTYYSDDEYGRLSVTLEFYLPDDADMIEVPIIVEGYKFLEDYWKEKFAELDTIFAANPKTKIHGDNDQPKIKYTMQEFANEFDFDFEAFGIIDPNHYEWEHKFSFPDVITSAPATEADLKAGIRRFYFYVEPKITNRIESHLIEAVITGFKPKI
ncbi:Uncharacterised protein [Mycoplasmopsis californica]|uniref:DUF4179 domain-containing protein n=1 Tax=Mycoplasmopsis equigenitalium TaxID=114883 RepID=A0ABY5J0X6_9BACT|nr:hypothetical protein [Mycoplasmopsis equigenitalium]UUD36874.1 hypothetical protein NPA09_03180 [Mycoplasmopsis equigenitalium]VEU69831.1 Uncharacterised protein [Mycoplasmopsis californica]